MFRLAIFCLSLGYALGGIPYVLVNDSVSLEGLPYIVQGETAEEGKYPYQASLHIGGAAKRKHFCGASILTKNWVMTAAHCCAAGSFDILVGTNSLSKGGQVYKTANTRIHPQYEPKKHWRNDICLMKTTSPITFSNTVKQVTLPPHGKELKEGDTLTVTGWGYTDPDSRVTPDRLQVGKNYRFISLKTCKSLTRVDTFEGYLCVMGNREGEGICQGDSGGPIVKDGVQYGIASFIFLPCGNVTPDFFARVANYVNWIKETLGPDAKDLKIAAK